MEEENSPRRHGGTEEEQIERRLDTEQKKGATEEKLIHGEMTGQIIGAPIEVHRILGPGLMESIYEECLCHGLRLRGLSFRRQVEVPIVYKGFQLGTGYRIDVLVEEKNVLELKAIEELAPVHESQLLTYMRLGAKNVGLLINFNVDVLKDCLIRRVL